MALGVFTGNQMGVVSFVLLHLAPREYQDFASTRP